MAAPPARAVLWITDTTIKGLENPAPAPALKKPAPLLRAIRWPS